MIQLTEKQWKAIEAVIRAARAAVSNNPDSHPTTLRLSDCLDELDAVNKDTQ